MIRKIIVVFIYSLKCNNILITYWEHRWILYWIAFCYLPRKNIKHTVIIGFVIVSIKLCLCKMSTFEKMYHIHTVFRIIIILRLIYKVIYLWFLFSVL